MRDNSINPNKRRIDKVLLYIEKNINQPLTLDKLAEISHLSPYHFHRIFKSEVGVSLNSHIKRVRLDYAIVQLQLTNKTITEIAYACGYQSCAAFSKAFKQHFNVSPLNYQRKLRTNKSNTRTPQLSQKSVVQQTAVEQSSHPIPPRTAKHTTTSNKKKSLLAFHPLGASHSNTIIRLKSIQLSPIKT